MLNKSYFNYLLKSKKYFVIIIFAIEFVLTIGSIGSYKTYNSINDQALSLYYFSAIVAFILPLIVFSYIHNKKAVDTYFSLSISRKELLFTGIIYCLAISFLSYLFSLFILIVGMLIKDVHSEILYLLNTIPVALLNYLTLIVFNSAIYLLANSLFDGILILGAYSFLPLAFYIIAYCFQGSFIVGVDIVNNYVDKYFVYLSPAAITFCSPNALKNLFVTSGGVYYGDVNFWVCIIVMIVYLILFTYLLYKNYLNRKLERSGDYSNDFFAYPFIIGVYTAISLLFIACCLNSYWSTYEVILLYALIFVLYIAANFIYKRKFSLPKIQTIMFIVGIVLSLLFNNICMKTNGFGLSNLYKFDYDLMNYECYVYADISENEITSFLKEISDNDEMFDSGFSMRIESSSKNKEVVDIFEKYRKLAIDDFYNYDSNQNPYYYSSLNVTYDKATVSSYSARKMDLDDIKEILKDDNKNVSININPYNYDYGSYYLIYEDGQYSLIEEEYYVLYSNYGIDGVEQIIETTTTDVDE